MSIVSHIGQALVLTWNVSAPTVKAFNGSLATFEFNTYHKTYHLFGSTENIL